LRLRFLQCENFVSRDQALARPRDFVADDARGWCRSSQSQVTPRPANALFFVGWRFPRHRCAGEFLWFRVLPFAIISESLIG
jgi:hypothetical protein